MIELFTDIPESLKKEAEFIFDYVIQQASDVSLAAEALHYYVQSRPEEYQEFLDFYFNLRLMEETK